MDDGDSPQLIESSKATNFSLSFFEVMSPRFEVADFRQLLRNYGIFDKWDVDLLVAYYYDEKSQEEITKQHNYVDRSTLSRRLKYLRGLLKERGFKGKR